MKNWRKSKEWDNDDVRICFFMMTQFESLSWNLWRNGGSKGVNIFSSYFFCASNELKSGTK